MNTSPVGSRTGSDFQIHACGIFHRFQRQRVKVVDGITFLLPPVGVQDLPEIALLIEQPETDERIILVAGRLQMIPGENAEAARVHRQRFGQPVLGRKVRDQLAVRRRGILARAGIERFACLPV